MIYLTGDCHGDFGRFAKRERMRLPYFLQPEDYVQRIKHLPMI